MSEFECKICGTCCMFYPITPLTKDEEQSGWYDIGKYVNGIALLATKRVWVPELKRKMVVCVYYDTSTQLCFMHGENKPSICKQEHCWGTQCMQEVELLKTKHMSLITRAWGDETE